MLSGILQAPNFNALTVVSLVAAIMSLSYSTIAFGMSLHSGKHMRNAPYNLNGYTTADGIFGAFNALGTVAFAYGRPLPSVAPAWSQARRMSKANCEFKYRAGRDLLCSLHKD